MGKWRRLKQSPSPLSQGTAEAAQEGQELSDSEDEEDHPPKAVLHQGLGSLSSSSLFIVPEPSSGSTVHAVSSGDLPLQVIQPTKVAFLEGE